MQKNCLIQLCTDGEMTGKVYETGIDKGDLKIAQERGRETKLIVF